MLPLLLYQLILLLVPLTLLPALCGRKKKSKNANTGRSNVSAKSGSTPPSQSEGGDMLKTARCAVVNGRPQAEKNRETGPKQGVVSSRISIHGSVHNTDVSVDKSIDKIELSCPASPDGINHDKAAPGKVLFSGKSARKNKMKSEKEKEKEIQGEQETQVTASNKSCAKSAMKKKENTLDGTQNTV